MKINIIIGVILSLISLFLIALILFRKNEPFFNCRKIIQDHFDLFSGCRSQYFVFYILPIFLSAGLSLLFTANAEFFSYLGTVLSIIIAILFSVLAILTSVDFPKFKNEEHRKRAELSVKQTINAILFCCIIGIFLLLIGFTAIVADTQTIEWDPCLVYACKTLISVISYYLFIVELLNLLLVIKNMSKIIEANMLAKGNEK